MYDLTILKELINDVEFPDKTTIEELKSRIIIKIPLAGDTLYMQLYLTGRDLYLSIYSTIDLTDYKHHCHHYHKIELADPQLITKLQELINYIVYETTLYTEHNLRAFKAYKTPKVFPSCPT